MRTKAIDNGNVLKSLRCWREQAVRPKLIPQPRAVVLRPVVSQPAAGGKDVPDGGKAGFPTAPEAIADAMQDRPRFNDQNGI